MQPKVAVVGLGVMGRRMMENMQRSGLFALHAGWDPDAAACQGAAQRFGLTIGESAEAVITDPAADLVYIASPPKFHKPAADLAIAAGKAVLCEKPLGIDLAESRALVEQAEAAGIKNAVNFPFAEAVAVEAIEAALADGSIGEPRAVDVRLHFCKWPRDWQEPAAWLTRREQGGFLRETFSHYAYLTRKLLGETRLEQAILRYPDDGISAETHVLALLDCGGLPVTLAGGTGGPDKSGADRVEFTLWGSRAAYRLFDWNRLTVSEGEDWQERLTEIPDKRQDGYRRMLENLSRFLRDEPNTMPSFREALAVQELVESILAQRF